MQAKDEFISNINEVSFLNSKVDGDIQNDKVLFKSIILLLCAKLEKFVKDSTKEYIKEIINLKLKQDEIPTALIKEIINNEIEKINSVTIENYITKSYNQERAKIFSIIWDKKFVLNTLNADEFVISISNNGTTAFKNVYKKIGLPNIIQELNDYKQADLYSETSFSIVDNIDRVIKLRHEIIHNDATPQITHTEISLYINIFTDFVLQIDKRMTEELQKLKTT